LQIGRTTSAKVTFGGGRKGICSQKEAANGQVKGGGGKERVVLRRKRRVMEEMGKNKATS